MFVQSYFKQATVVRYWVIFFASSSAFEKSTEITDMFILFLKMICSRVKLGLTLLTINTNIYSLDTFIVSDGIKGY